MERVSRELLQQSELPEGYLGWTMVVLASEFWRDQVAAVPPARRLLLLPHCLKHAEGCPADYDEFGLDCLKCGACSIADFRGMAEQMGYKVLVAEGSPIVLKIIVSGHVDAIVGVACLNVLEKAIDKILLSGVPCMAVPLLSSDCRNTSVDESWVSEMIQEQSSAPSTQTRSYVHLLRTAHDVFGDDQLKTLAPRLRNNDAPVRLNLQEPSAASPLQNGNGVAKTAAAKNGHPASGSPLDSLDPVAATEAIAYDFLARGGKHSRPFITLAVHDALTGAQGTAPDGAAALSTLPPSVLRAALSIETFHKASLVHDDIEDNDAYRYGEATLHRMFGTATAINVGDYLIGLGYRLVSRETESLGAEVAAEILDTLAAAHLKLTEGQGAELAWRDARDKALSPIDALKIYALKTSPAFEAALMVGARLAGPTDALAEPFKRFSQSLGIAFQVLNDLQDWQGDDHNKLARGSDILGGRPTVLLALALEGATADGRRKLLDCLASEENVEQRLQQVRVLYQEASVFDAAHRLVDKYQEKAEAIADAIEPDELRRLLYYLVDTVLERPDEPEPVIVAAPANAPLPLTPRS